MENEERWNREERDEALRQTNQVKRTEGRGKAQRKNPKLDLSTVCREYISSLINNSVQRRSVVGIAETTVRA